MSLLGYAFTSGDSISQVTSRMCVKLVSRVRLFCDPMGCSLPGSSVYGIAQDTGVGCQFLLQVIFLTQGSNHISYIAYICRQILYH